MKIRASRAWAASCCLGLFVGFCVAADTPPQTPQKNLPIKGEVFTVRGRTAFLILPEKNKSGTPIPWVWYAPTLKGLPGELEKWMFEKFLDNGIAIAGIDVGESHGSPNGTALYSALYKELVEKRGLAKQACLLARSRGGLMLYNWAVENPTSVACMAGIYPVSNLSSYPGLARACGAYGMTEEQLAEKLTEHNPIDRLAPLAKAKVPIFHIHGDSDKTVPLDQNSGELKKRYDKLGGEMTLEVVKGQGHNVWPGWFHSQQLVDFVIAHARGNVVTIPATATAAVKDPPPSPVISLAGQWRFALDADGKGVGEKWFARRLDEAVTLPGTTDENHKGIFKDEHCIDRLSRVWCWKGPAWYQRDVTIPEEWKGKHITLVLERAKHTAVWVDETRCGTRDSLSAPLVFDLSAAMAPGKHTVSLLVDNSILPPVGQSHAFDERTQTNWNGVIGRIELRATDAAWLDDVQVYPDVKNRTAVVKALIGNTTGRPVEGEIEIVGETFNSDKSASFRKQSFPVRVADANGTVEAACKLGDDAPLWDEFSPAMIRLKVDLMVRSGKGAAWRDSRTVDFGLRQFSTRSGQFTINGRPTFLRGKLDSAIFPLTGHPPMDKAGWLSLLGTAKSYGINHYRFHSWCPPEAAFEAADELGMYLQPELPNKSTAFQKPEHGGYLTREGELIFRAFGNHPSFVMFTLGNELGRRPEMFEMVRHFQQIDPRRLYAQGSNNVHWDPSQAAGDDFWVTGKTRSDLAVRGSFFQGDYDAAYIENRPPSTMVDFSESIAGVSVPVVGHETGQYQVSPDFREIPRYTGVLKARNLEIFRQRLADANMLDQAGDFVRASGALAVICYREDIEAALRTPGLGGFQLLDLQDFSGQGTALVGILNAFMESKGLVTPQQWRRFCCPVVPLLRMKKYTWTTDEKFIGRVQVAHYGQADLAGAEVTWTVADARGRRVAGGTLGPVDIKQGNVRDVDMFCFPLAGVQAPCKLVITLSLKAAPYANSYDIWVYPPKVATAPTAGATVARSLDADAWARLGRGEKVLLLPDLKTLEDPDKSVAGSFQCDFWCWPMFKRAAEQMKVPVAPGTLGILCDPNLPALAGFPTEFHTNWQWWQLVKHSRPVILDATQADWRPTVQVIDNFARNHKLGLVFETKVGKGKLLVCAIDLPALQGKPEARQLLSSLLSYAASAAFDPKAELDAAMLRRLFPSH